MNEIEEAKKEAIRRNQLVLEEGMRSKQLYDNPVVVEAFAEIRQTIYDNIESSSWSSQEEREELYRMLKTLAAFKAQFERRISEGEKAESTLRRLINKVRQLA
jgi:signal transduction protein with GAF and PtsI domain|tara:strand:+ start:110 stop:418 length:309 start_codon:yes stop_codon:yes gene_type:complete